MLCCNVKNAAGSSEQMLRLECCCQTVTAWCLVLQTTGNTRAAVGVSQCLLRVGLNPPEQEEISFWHLGAPGCEKGIQLLRWMLGWEHNRGVSKGKINAATVSY